MRKSPKNWGGERRLQLGARGSCESCSRKIARSGDCSLFQREQVPRQILEYARPKHGTNFPNSDCNPRLRCSFVTPSVEELEGAPVHKGLDSLDWSCI